MILAFINGVKRRLFIPLGFLFIIFFSLCSKARPILGKLSVTKSINKIWIGKSIKLLVNSPIKTINISAKLLERE